MKQFVYKAFYKYSELILIIRANFTCHFRETRINRSKDLHLIHPSHGTFAPQILPK